MSGQGLLRRVQAKTQKVGLCGMSFKHYILNHILKHVVDEGLSRSNATLSLWCKGHPHVYGEDMMSQWCGASTLTSRKPGFESQLHHLPIV